MKNKTIKSIKIDIFPFEYVKQKMQDALTEDIKEDPEGWAREMLVNGIPKLDPDNLIPFIEWHLFRFDLDFPNKYGIQTHDGIWLVSGDRCIVWEALP